MSRLSYVHTVQPHSGLAKLMNFYGKLNLVSWSPFYNGSQTDFAVQARCGAILLALMDRS
jgi:hypothetical protein